MVLFIHRYVNKQKEGCSYKNVNTKIVDNIYYICVIYLNILQTIVESKKGKGEKRMKTPKTFLLLSVVVAVLILGIAYAAIQDVTLTVNGTATASPDQDNFTVKFANPSEITGDGSGSLTVDSDITKATLAVSGLKKVGDQVTATIDVVNTSTDLGANLVASVSAIAETLTKGENDTVASTGEYFRVTATLDNPSITKVVEGNGDQTTLNIIVELIKAPIEGDVVGKFTVTVVASPTN